MGGQLPLGVELWQQRRVSAFTGSLQVVGEKTTQRRRNESVPEGSLGKVPSVRILSRLITTGRENLRKAEAIAVAKIAAKVPALDGAMSPLSRFRAMIRERSRSDLAIWIEAAASSLLSSFARGLLNDKSVRSSSTYLKLG